MHTADDSSPSCCAAGREQLGPDTAASQASAEGTDSASVAAPVRRGPEHPHAFAAPSEQARARAQHAVPIEAGPFRMGTEDVDRNPMDAESPIREVEVGAFRIDPTCVTNAEFAAFVDETGYVTEAEEFGWSYVFGALLEPEVRRSSPKPPGTPWWRAVHGARWDAPEGPGSDAEDRADHPVVHVSVRDAEAFAAWCGMRLPREAEWEKAARGGIDQARYAWGDDLTPDGEHRCNIWQGAFPVRNTLEDGYLAATRASAWPPTPDPADRQALPSRRAVTPRPQASRRPLARSSRWSSTTWPLERRPPCSYSLVTQVRRRGSRAAVAMEYSRGT